MERLGIRYDLLARESEILHLHFWERAFQLMKERNAIHFASEGRNRGCWVMPFESHTGTEEHESDKIIVRSNGTVTYTGKDIAYQLWKLGRLGLDFNYRPFRKDRDEHVTWVTSTDSNAETLPEVPRPNFGGGAAAIPLGRRIQCRQRSQLLDDQRHRPRSQAARAKILRREPGEGAAAAQARAETIAQP